MRAKEFISEQIREPLPVDVARALPGTYTIPGLPNSDFYLQYRFGVSLAGAKGAKQREDDNIKPYSRESEWGENLVVSSHMDPDLPKDIDYALSQLGMKGKRLISTLKSEEAPDVPKNSPMQPFKGYKK